MHRKSLPSEHNVEKIKLKNSVLERGKKITLFLSKYNFVVIFQEYLYNFFLNSALLFIKIKLCFYTEQDKCNTKIFIFYERVISPQFPSCCGKINKGVNLTDQ